MPTPGVGVEQQATCHIMPAVRKPCARVRREGGASDENAAPRNASAHRKRRRQRRDAARRYRRHACCATPARHELYGVVVGYGRGEKRGVGRTAGGAAAGEREGCRRQVLDVARYRFSTCRVSEAAARSRLRRAAMASWKRHTTREGGAQVHFAEGDILKMLVGMCA